MTPDPDAQDRSAPWGLLALLTLLNVLNFLDRHLLAAAAPRLVAELRLTNAQLGFLVGFAFVAFFAVATLFVGALADRLSRTRLIAAGVVLWSIMTAATGAASAFTGLAAARLFIGLGEAVLVPAALSLLADRFPAWRLGLACGLFWAGLPVGRALSYFVAATLVPEVGWRACFYVLGAAGLPLAAALLFVADTPRRVPEAPPSASSLGEAGRALSRLASLRWIVAGNVLAAVAGSASQLEVAWLTAERGFSPERAALAGGIVVTLASVVGNPLVGALGDRWERKRAGGRLRCLAIVLAAVMPLAAGFYVLTPGSAAFYACWLAAQVALAAWPGTSSAAIQDLVPVRIRAATVAMVMAVVNLAGIGPGAWLAGAIGDALSLTAGLLAATAIGFLAVVPYVLAATSYPGPGQGRTADEDAERRT
ncbi:MAG TPA: MFS transporter [Vicinamibacteria bacterium]|nr:MFS transporter [Vicinamibacteria bacterium]